MNETLTDAPTTNMLTLVNAPTSNVARLVYKSPVLTQNVRLSGTVKVSLWMSFSKPKANLTAVFVDLPATGTLPSNGTFQERSTRGWLDPENRATTLPSRVDRPRHLLPDRTSTCSRRTSSRSRAGGSGS